MRNVIVSSEQVVVVEAKMVVVVGHFSVIDLFIMLK